MDTHAKFTIHQRDMDAAKVERLKSAHVALSAARKEIEDEFKATEHYALLQKMVKAGNAVTLVWNASNSLDVSYQLQEDFLANRDARKGNQPLYIGEKTINTLLHGKLLSDDEKRALIERVTQGAIPAKQPA